MGFLAYCSYAICRTPLLPLLARELGADAADGGLRGWRLDADRHSRQAPRRRMVRPPRAAAAAHARAPSCSRRCPSRTWESGRWRRWSPCDSFTEQRPPFSVPWRLRACPISLRQRRRATWLSTYSTVQGCGASARSRHRRLSDRPRPLRPGVSSSPASSLWPRRFSPPDGPRRPRPPVGAQAAASELARGILEVGRQPLILMTSLAQAAQFVLNGTLNAFLPLFARDVIGLTASQLGWLFALQTATTLATRPAHGHAVRPHRPTRRHRRGFDACAVARCGSSRRRPG